MRKITLILFPFCLIIIGDTSLAQDITYNRLVHSFEEIEIKPGDRITILTTALQRKHGIFLLYAEGNLIMQDAAEPPEGEFVIPFTDIRFLRTEFDKSRKALNYGIIGGVVGIFAGIPVGTHLIQQRGEEESVSDAFLYIASSLGSGVIGGMIGIGIGLIALPGDVIYKIEHAQE